MTLKSGNIWVMAILILLAGCADVERDTIVDLDEQRKKDIAIIEEYLKKNNLVADTTERGARYVILETGRGDSIRYNEIAAVDYIGFSLAGEVFDTSIPEVADTAFAQSVASLLVPQYFTYTQTGWTFEFIRLTNQFAGGLVNGRALGEAMTKALIKMRVGGKLLVILPSDQAFEAQATQYFDSYSVVIFEIYPVPVD